MPRGWTEPEYDGRDWESASELLWDERRGVYVDAADERSPRRLVSQQTNAIAIVSGCAPPQRWSRILEAILDERRLVIAPEARLLQSGMGGQMLDPAEVASFDPEWNVVAAQPFFAHILHQAVVRAGRRDLIPSLCDRWFPLLQGGDGTIGARWGGPPGLVRRAHAWSATPAYDLTTHVLGVRPLEPGYRRAAMNPLFGVLNKLSGSVPTPYGPIEIDLSRSAGQIVIPDGVEAVVSFEDAPLAGGTFGQGQHRLEEDL
ncbi:MAG: alpha-L-rhamnosidase C-terminal domain-containing protein [Dehalococcoidia bacterium]